MKGSLQALVAGRKAAVNKLLDFKLAMMCAPFGN